MTWVYTAMHGVGYETLRAILQLAGYPEPTVVEAQIAPDGRFPTVAFPNPEEPARWTSLSRRRGRRMPSSSSPTTPTPTAWRSRSPTPPPTVAGGA